MTDTRNMTLRNLTDYYRPDLPDSALTDAPNGLFKESKENTDALVKALEEIRSGSFDGASTLAVSGSWKLIAERLQKIAAKALAKMQLSERDYSLTRVEDMGIPDEGEVK